MTEEASDPTLWQLAQPCIQSALRKILEAKEAGIKFETHWSRRSLLDKPDGSREKDHISPVDYGSIFSAEEKYGRSGYTFYDIENFSNLLNYATANPTYKTFLGLDRGSDDLGQRMALFATADLVREVAARHVETIGFEYNREDAFKLYREMERWWLNEDLTVDVVVPLLGAAFDSDEFDIGDAHIEKVETDLLSSGWPDSSHLSDLGEKLLLRSQVAWVYPNLEVETGFHWGNIDAKSSESFDELRRFVQVIQASTREPVGVDSIIYRFNGWTRGYIGQLPAASYAGRDRRYLNGLQTRGNDSPATTLNSQDIARRFDSLKNSSPQVKLAAERLLGGNLRADSVDKTLDICIGLEALVGDDSPNETTYKLALRTAALLAYDGYKTIRDIFGVVKKIYAYRSAIAHGSPKADSKSVINAFDGRFRADDIAAFFLQEAIRIVLDEPEIASKIPSDEIIFDMLSLAGKELRSTDEAT